MFRQKKYRYYNVSQTKQRFTIKKFKFGVTSVLLGLTFLGVGGYQVLANESDSKVEATQSNTSPNTTSVNSEELLSTTSMTEERKQETDQESVLNTEKINSSLTTYSTIGSEEYNPRLLLLSNGVPSDNVHSLGGGVDVTPLEAKNLGDGFVEYSYQVSVQAIVSSDHIQTSGTVHVALPGFGQDVKFTQIGTYDGELLKDNAEFSPFELLHARMTASKNVEVPLGITHSIEAFNKTQEERHAQREANNYDYITGSSLAFNEEIELRKAKGMLDLPNAVIFTGYTQSGFNPAVDVFDDKDSSNPAKTIEENIAKYENLPNTIKNYVFSTYSGGHPMAVKVSFKVKEEQALKTPNLPLWSALAWRAFNEGGIASYKTEAQNLYDFDNGAKAAAFVANPETIKDNQFDKHGLYGADTGVTAYTGDWRLIGTDITKANFNYVSNFNLTSNLAVTYFAPRTEDVRDIAVVRYETKPDTQPQDIQPNPDSVSPVESQPTDNIHTLGGGVDVTPLEARDLGDGFVEYSYQISVQAVQSSDHIQTANTLHVALPGIGQDVTFTQIGTYNKDDLGIDEYDKDKLRERRLKASKDVEVPLGVTTSMAEFEKTQEERLALLKANNKENYFQYTSLAWNEEIELRKARGLDTLPNAIVFAGLSKNEYNAEADSPRDYDNILELGTIEEQIEKYGDRPNMIKNYLLSAEGIGHPLALRISFKVSKEQALKIRNLPLWASIAWRSFAEGYIGSYDNGSQSLYDYPGGRMSAQFISYPEHIHKEQFDKNGLYGTTAGVTRYTGDWRFIGNDVSQSSFNYAAIYNLRSNLAVTYFAPIDEDLRDIAVVRFEEQSETTEEPNEKVEKPTEDQTETPTPNETPNEPVKPGEKIEQPKNPTGKTTSSEALPPKQPMEQKVAQLLPKTGETENRFFSVAMLAIVSSISLLFGTKKKQN
ncbi:YSIRK-type signal peptide-containing protein [Carnobacteriaceae bacterium zg-84]|uniref:LPXTG cell wall anchor domain-containing protein n=1 Tax=Granulicatella sp. zg-84 TaxID=2678503 RepID=UPI0013BEC510|nr:LPXTG cell wall anchor domain-containing protein [Granulicatella sp. zg-84]NEW66684.1 YSIRK-type signal peptide-containing protein [Granulicatella sp. zg-84]QMI85012.1 YSIRK-type signal peptide-containing protein [Carnobacteriaceae bacterium zg-84]